MNAPQLRYTLLRTSRALHNFTQFRAISSTSKLLQSLRAKQVEHQAHGNLLKVTWTNGSANHYPYAYLRDHCLCPSCYKAHPQGVFFHTNNTEVSQTACDVHVSETSGAVSIKWRDGHTSEFPSDWLLTRMELSSNEAIPWNNEFQIPRFPFETLLANEHVLCDWLKAMKQYGLTILTGASPQIGQLPRFRQAVGVLFRKAYSGKTAFVNKSAPQVPDLAQIATHADVICCEQKPSFRAVHCISRAKSQHKVRTFVDGLHVAQVLKRRNPECFELMASTLVRHRVNGTEPTCGEFGQLSAKPIIQLNVRGQFTSVNVYDSLKDEFLDAPVDKLAEVHQAYQTLSQMLYSQQLIVRYEMSPGDVCVVDNDRVLHGSSSNRSSCSVMRYGGRNVGASPGVYQVI